MNERYEESGSEVDEEEDEEDEDDVAEGISPSNASRIQISSI